MFKIFILLLASLIAQPSVAQLYDIPDFGSPADAIMSISQEQQLGSSIYAQILASNAILENPIVYEYLYSLGSNIAVYAQNGDFEFNFFTVNDSEVNAFALPGGFIGIHTGLINETTSESELAGVLAHEIAHVTQRHISRSYLEQQKDSMVGLATMIAGAILAGMSSSSDAASGAMMAGTSVMQQGQINFTRSMEIDADRVGVQTLNDSGYDPMGMPMMFEKIARLYGNQQRLIPEFLQTHPVTVTRIAETRSRANELNGPYKPTSDSYQIVKAIIAYNNFDLPSQAKSFFQSGLETEGENLGNLYGLILSSIDLGELSEVSLYLDKIRGINPNLIAFVELEARSLMAQGNSDRAITLLTNNLVLTPRNPVLIDSLSMIYMNQNDPGKAHELLLDLLNNSPARPYQIMNLATYAQSMGNESLSHYYLAEYYISLRNLMAAEIQLDIALENLNLEPTEREKYLARRKQVNDALNPENR
jgi:beta-barrel assembly-enhancing protease